MKELLYKKSEAVAALNRVDGFHPMELARKIGEEGQEEQLYLDVKYRKLWFRLVNPAGKIISRIITFTENMADRKSTRLNSSHSVLSRMPSSA